MRKLVHEEVDREIVNKSVNIAIKMLKPELDQLMKGLSKAVQAPVKAAGKAAVNKIHPTTGKQSVKTLIRQGQGVSSIPLADEGLKDFQKIAKKYGVDFAVVKDKEATNTATSQIFLGGTEQTTLKDLNAILGKETIDMYNTGQSKGSQESYNMNYQKLGKDLMTMDELAVMDGSKCIVQVRGVRPFLSDKYDLTQHPNYKLTADYDKRNYFDVVKFLSHNLILKADDEYQVIDVTE